MGVFCNNKTAINSKAYLLLAKQETKVGERVCTAEEKREKDADVVVGR